MAEVEQVGKRVLFDPATLERATDAAKERGMSLNRFVGLAIDDFCARLLPADEIIWTRPEQTTWPKPLATTPIQEDEV